MKPKIVAHRGLWKTREEQNTPAAFRAALRAGFGVELDVRDRAGELVVSHDPPGPGVCFTLKQILEFMPNRGPRPLLVNVKSCGLAPLLAREAMGDAAFCFDMTLPDMVEYRDLGLPYLVRASPYEPMPATPELFDASPGIWYDVAFGMDHIPMAAPMPGGKFLAVASPELHGRPHRLMWEWIRQYGNDRTILCTDLAEDAEKFFR